MERWDSWDGGGGWPGAATWRAGELRLPDATTVQYVSTCSGGGPPFGVFSCSFSRARYCTRLSSGAFRPCGCPTSGRPASESAAGCPLSWLPRSGLSNNDRRVFGIASTSHSPRLRKPVSALVARTAQPSTWLPRRRAHLDVRRRVLSGLPGQDARPQCEYGRMLILAFPVLISAVLPPDHHPRRSWGALATTAQCPPGELTTHARLVASMHVATRSRDMYQAERCGLPDASKRHLQ